MNVKILSLYLVFGFLILIGYGLMVRNYYKNGSTDIWSNQGKNIITKHKLLKYIYICMISLSLIASVYLIYYLTNIPENNNDNDKSMILIYTGSVIFLLYSTIWAFKPYYYSKFVLFMVFVGVVLFFSGILVNIDENGKFESIENIIAILACCILIIQTGLFDFGIWTGLLKF